MAWPVLLWVARHRVVTSHQVLYRFWWLAARHPRHGARVIRLLIRHGYLTSTSLDRQRGRASVRVLAPTSLARRMVAGRPGGRELLGRKQLVGLAWTQLALTWESAGWRELRDHDERWAAVREWGLAPYHGHRGNASDRTNRAAIERMAPQRFGTGVQVWAHRTTGGIRVAIAAGHPAIMTRRLNALPKLGLFPPLPIALVGDGWSDLEAAEATLERWARRRANKRVRLERVAVEPYTTSPSPLTEPLPPVSRYKETDSPSPLDLVHPAQA